jgi:hypothetical protein
MIRNFPPAFLFLVVLGGCLGGAGEGPAGADGPGGDDAASGELRAGSYEGDYGYIPDSLRQGFEAELILNPDGTYRNIWIQHSEAVYDERGEWSQKGASLFLRNSTESWADYRVFDESKPIDDDTCRLEKVTDTAFTRNEWIPVVLRKRQWTRYRRKAYPVIPQGLYQFILEPDSSALEDSANPDAPQPPPQTYRMRFRDGQYEFSVSDSSESYQSRSSYYQIGSLLALENTQERDRDTTPSGWSDWRPVPGSTLQRLRVVTDSSLEIWYPGSLFLPASWDHYSRIPE